METLAVSAILGIVILSLTQSLSSIGDSVNDQKRAIRIENAILSVSQKTQNFLNADLAYNFTYAANPTLQCDNVIDPCWTVKQSATPADLIIKDFDNNTFYQATGISNRFTEFGENCPTLSDYCPIQMTVKFFPTCPNGSPCSRTPLHFSGTFTLDSSYNVNRNFNEFKFVIVRQSFEANDVKLAISHSLTDGGGGGPCAALNWEPRPLNAAPQYDPSSNIVEINTVAKTFTLSPGLYECNLRVESYGSGLRRVRLRNVSFGATYVSRSSYSINNSSRTLEINKIKFLLTADSVFTIEQYSTSDLTGTNCMGMAGTSGEDVEFLNFDCSGDD